MDSCIEERSDRQINIQTAVRRKMDKQTHKQIDLWKKTYSHTDGQTDIQVGRYIEEQTDRRAIAKHTETRQADRWRDRHTDGLTDVPYN